MCQNCNQNNCGGCTETTTICNQCSSEQATCDCEIIDFKSDCILYVGDDIECNSVVVVPKNTILTDALALMTSHNCTKFDELANYLRIINVGTGASIYAGDNLIGEKKLRKINSTSPIVTVTENTNDISLGIDSASLDTFIEANQKTYTAANIGTGANVYKDSTVVGNNTQLNFRKIKSSDSSVSIVEGTSDIDVTVSAGIVPDGSETKVTAGTNVSVTGTGTVATPYVVNGLYPPLERIDEGNGNGYIIRGRNATFYGNVGVDAVDLSYSNTISSVLGATGESSFAQGVDVVAGGYGAVSMGEDLSNSGTLSAVFGKGGVVTAGYGNFLTGGFNEVTSGAYATVVGQVAEVVVNNIADTNADTNTMFAVGNGTVDGGGLPLVRSTALKVLQSGLVIVPKQTVSLIDSDDKAVVTKEYLHLQKVITYPADFTGTNYTLTNADNNYTIFVNNASTAVTITLNTSVTISNFCVGFVQEGTADVTHIGTGVTLTNPVGLKIKGQGYQSFIERKLATSIYYLLGNTKV